MSNNFNEEIFEGMLRAAFTEYSDKEIEALPSIQKAMEEHPMPKKLERKIKRKLKEREHRQPLYIVYLKRAAVILLAVLSVSFGALMLDTDVRAKVTDAVIGWFEDFISFDFSPNKEELGKFEATSVDSLTVGYVPEGFKMYNETKDSTSYNACYVNNDNKYVIISIMETEDFGVSTDTEHHGYDEIVINNYIAFITYDDKQKTGSIVWGNNYLTINISASTSYEEIIKIAESIKESK